MRPLDPPNVNKLYFRIGEVSRIVGIEPSVIRYWETEFPSLRPRRSKTGQRVYTQADLKRIETIKHLRYDLGLTAAGALKVMRGQGLEVRASDDPVVADNERLRASLHALRQQLIDFIEELDREKGNS